MQFNFPLERILSLRYSFGERGFASYYEEFLYVLWVFVCVAMALNDFFTFY